MFYDKWYKCDIPYINKASNRKCIMHIVHRTIEMYKVKHISDFTGDFFKVLSHT